MAKAPVKIYENPGDTQPIADLGKAENINYVLHFNKLSEASFDLPVSSPHYDKIDGFMFAEIHDGNKDLGFFRINRTDLQGGAGKEKTTFTCKQVLDTLNDKRIQEPVTKTGVMTALNYIIDQQEITNWQLGTVDDTFKDDTLEYEFERQTLLSAIMDVTSVWWEELHIDLDTSSYPWTLNIVQPDTEPTATIQEGKNLDSISPVIDWEPLITRLFAYGSGSGEDQVTAGPFESNVSKFGVVEGEFSEPYFETAAKLEEAALKYLDIVDTPRVEYHGQATDFYRLFETNDIGLGDNVTVYHEKLDIDVTARVVKVEKSDVLGEPAKLIFSLNNELRTKPNYGALAYKDQADERDLASSSVRGGSGGALAGGSTGTNELADESVTFDKIQFKDDSGNYVEQTRLKIDAFVTFESNFTEIDKLEDGTTYAKMRADWRSASDITMIDGGTIYTDTVIPDAILFSDTFSEETVGSINAHKDYLSIDADALEITSSSSIDIEADGALTLKASNIKLEAFDSEGAKAAINLDPDLVTIAGENIELDGDTTVKGTFTVEGENIILDADTTIGSGYTLSAEHLVIDADLDFGEGSYSSITGIQRITGESGEAIYFSAGLSFSKFTLSSGAPDADLGGNAITNVGDVDGVNISVFKSDYDDHIDVSSAHHDPYTDSEVQDLITAGNALTKTTGTDLLELSVSEASIDHGNLGGVSASQHHSKYTDYEAVSAVEDENGISLSGKLDMGLNDIENVGTIDGKDIGGWGESSQKVVEDLDVTTKEVALADGGSYTCLLIDGWTAGGTIYYVSH